MSNQDDYNATIEENRKEAIEDFLSQIDTHFPDDKPKHLVLFIDADPGMKVTYWNTRDEALDFLLKATLFNEDFDLIELLKLKDEKYIPSRAEAEENQPYPLFGSDGKDASHE